MAKRSHQPTPDAASQPEHDHEHDAPHGVHLHAADYLARRAGEEPRYADPEAQALDAAGLLCRGMIYAHHEHLDEALADFNHAIKLDPDHADATMQRGYALFGKGNLNGALSDFRAYSKLYPDDPIGHNNQAFVFFQLGRTTQAESAWNRATRLPFSSDCSAPPSRILSSEIAHCILRAESIPSHS